MDMAMDQSNHDAHAMGSNSNMNGDSLTMGKQNHTMDMNMDMKMYFVISEQVTLLFRQWKTTNAGEMIGSCLALFVLGVLYEGLKIWRQNILLKPSNFELQVDFSENNTTDSSSTFLKNSNNNKLGRWSRFSKKHIIQTFLHMLQVTIGYFLMLAFMTYNVWICIAVILGAGFGYFLFGAQPIILNADHCN